MKTIQKLPMMEARTVALLVGLTVGLGIAVHEFFFVVALGIVLVVAGEWTARSDLRIPARLQIFYRHP